MFEKLRNWFGSGQKPETPTAAPLPPVRPLRDILDEVDFNTTTEKGNVMVIYTNGLCGGCRILKTTVMYNQVVGKALDDRGIEVVCMNTDNAVLLGVASRKGVAGLPTIDIYGDKGTHLHRAVGTALPDEVLNLINTFYGPKDDPAPGSTAPLQAKQG